MIESQFSGFQKRKCENIRNARITNFSFILKQCEADDDYTDDASGESRTLFYLSTTRIPMQNHP